MGLAFVYELSYEGIIFYVGTTDNPYRRYLEHRVGDMTSGSIVRFLRSKDKTFDFKLVYVSNSAIEIDNMETRLINLYASMKIELCNVDKNPSSNRILYKHTRKTKRSKTRLTHESVKTHINHVIETYKEGKFRYQCLGYSTSISRQIGYPRSERS